MTRTIMNHRWVEFWQNLGFVVQPGTNGQMLIRKTDSTIAFLEVSTDAWNLTCRKSVGTYGTNRVVGQWVGCYPERELEFAFTKFRNFYQLDLTAFDV